MIRFSTHLIAALAVLTVAGAPGQALAEETVTRTGLFYQLGKAINRALVAKPQTGRTNLGKIDRVHYANTVYHYEGISGARHDIYTSRGLFVHVDLDDPATIKPGHSLAER